MYSFENEYMCRFENLAISRGFNFIGGIDEAGRGALAGPVVAACVILNTESIPAGILDSKKLSNKKRNDLFEKIYSAAQTVGVGVVDPNMIDEINIYNATKMAMRRAISKMEVRPDFLLIDAVKLYDIPISSMSINKGEDKSVSIAAASIIAKVYRDRMMIELSKEYPQYGFSAHKGYGTSLHRQNLLKYGPSAIHRYSYRPVLKVYEIWKLKT
jgi:ribonuclease HII